MTSRDGGESPDRDFDRAAQLEHVEIELAEVMTKNRQLEQQLQEARARVTQLEERIDKARETWRNLKKRSEQQQLRLGKLRERMLEAQQQLRSEQVKRAFFEARCMRYEYLATRPG
jgi:chromosome segregation ATPase